MTNGRSPRVSFYLTHKINISQLCDYMIHIFDQFKPMIGIIEPHLMTWFGAEIVAMATE